MTIFSGAWIKDNTTGKTVQVEAIVYQGDKEYAVYTGQGGRKIRVRTTRIKHPGEKGNRKNGYTYLEQAPV